MSAIDPQKFLPAQKMAADLMGMVIFTQELKEPPADAIYVVDMGQRGNIPMDIKFKPFLEESLAMEIWAENHAKENPNGILAKGRRQTIPIEGTRQLISILETIGKGSPSDFTEQQWKSAAGAIDALITRYEFEASAFSAGLHNIVGKESFADQQGLSDDAWKDGRTAEDVREEVDGQLAGHMKDVLNISQEKAMNLGRAKIIFAKLARHHNIDLDGAGDKSLSM